MVVMGAGVAMETVLCSYEREGLCTGISLDRDAKFPHVIANLCDDVHAALFYSVNACSKPRLLRNAVHMTSVPKGF